MGNGRVIVLALIVLLVVGSFYVFPERTKEITGKIVLELERFVYEDLEDVARPIEKNFTGETITIANWNIQVFGRSKMNKSGVVNVIVDKMDDYDIIFVEEVRDSSGEAFVELCTLLEDYDCLISERSGRSTSKEQIGVVFRKGIEAELENLEDPEDLFERDLVKVSFNVSNYLFVSYPVHLKPDDADSEMYFLEDVVVNSGNVVVLGDTNLDGSYSKGRQDHFSDYVWLISDDEDTTVAKSDNAYDRIILNDDMNEEFVDYGIDVKGITEEVSDHYLVWVEIGI
jgi:hypothetical protein